MDATGSRRSRFSNLADLHAHGTRRSNIPNVAKDLEAHRAASADHASRQPARIMNADDAFFRAAETDAMKVPVASSGQFFGLHFCNARVSA
ncbi:hypothetical protein [Afipia broomeae]|uniref:hypothetical protein n=1 Tax=Afipia broomeae TaxID=56946 RepID=UPI0012FA4C05|nr:hypothetical protein [Afipia broomeae]